MPYKTDQLFNTGKLKKGSTTFGEDFRFMEQDLSFPGKRLKQP